MYLTGSTMSIDEIFDIDFIQVKWYRKQKDQPKTITKFGILEMNVTVKRI